MDFRVSLLSFCALLTIGCGSVGLRATYRSMGELDLARDARVRASFETAINSKKHAPQAKVRVLVDALPKGIELKGNVISVADGYTHNVIGKFYLRPNRRAFPPYKKKWRRYACYPQVPLTWLTLGMWAIFVPTYYPCFTRNASDAEEIVTAAQHIASAAKGDVAVISFSGRTQDGEQAIGATGFIIKLDPRMKNGPLKTVPRKKPSIDI